MKNVNEHKHTFFSRFWNGLVRNVNALLESSEKREFQRLKKFIAS